MISVKTTKENGFYKKVAILGHAMYADYGKIMVFVARAGLFLKPH